MKIIYFLRSLVCDFFMYLSMLVIGVIGFPIALISKQQTYRVIRFYCKTVFFFLRVVANLRVEIRGTIPTEKCLICSKHQSFLDVLMLASVLPDFRFIMKHQLVHLPIVGFYARQVGCVAVNRDKKGGTVKKMIRELRKDINRQTIVYPQGTRVIPGARLPYKQGAGIIYTSLEKKCYLVATNTGIFWARRSYFRYPGTAVIDFFECIDEGIETDLFMSQIEEKIEKKSDELMNEAS